MQMISSKNASLCIQQLYKQLNCRRTVQVVPLSSPPPCHNPCDLMRWIHLIADEVAKPLSIIFENLWQSSEVPSDCRRGNIVHTFKKAKKEKQSNTNQPVLQCPEKPWIKSPGSCTMEHGKYMIGGSQHGFAGGKSWLQIWWPPMMGLQHWWRRKERWMSPSWTSAKHLILSHSTSLSLKWRDTFTKMTILFFHVCQCNTFLGFIQN